MWMMGPSEKSRVNGLTRPQDIIVNAQDTQSRSILQYIEALVQRVGLVSFDHHLVGIWIFLGIREGRGWFVLVIAPHDLHLGDTLTGGVVQDAQDQLVIPAPRVHADGVLFPVNGPEGSEVDSRWRWQCLGCCIGKARPVIVLLHVPHQVILLIDNAEQIEVYHQQEQEATAHKQEHFGPCHDNNWW